MHTQIPNRIIIVDGAIQHRAIPPQLGEFSDRRYLRGRHNQSYRVNRVCGHSAIGRELRLTSRNPSTSL